MKQNALEDKQKLMEQVNLLQAELQNAKDENLIQKATNQDLLAQVALLQNSLDDNTEELQTSQDHIKSLSREKRQLQEENNLETLYIKSTCKMHTLLYILCKCEYANENANEFANAQMRSKCSIFNNNHNHCLPKLQYSRESLYKKYILV